MSPDFGAGWDGKPIPFWLYKLHGMGHLSKWQIGVCGRWHLCLSGMKGVRT